MEFTFNTVKIKTNTLEKTIGKDLYYNLESGRCVKNTDKIGYTILDFGECGYLDDFDEYRILPPYKLFGAISDIDGFMYQNKIIRSTYDQFANRNKYLNDDDDDDDNKHRVNLPEIDFEEFPEIGVFSIFPELQKKCQKGSTISVKKYKKSTKGKKTSIPKINKNPVESAPIINPKEPPKIFSRNSTPRLEQPKMTNSLSTPIITKNELSSTKSKSISTPTPTPILLNKLMTPRLIKEPSTPKIIGDLSKQNFEQNISDLTTNDLKTLTQNISDETNDIPRTPKQPPIIRKSSSVNNCKNDGGKLSVPGTPIIEKNAKCCTPIKPSFDVSFLSPIEPKQKTEEFENRIKPPCFRKK